MKIPFFDLKKQNQTLKNELLKAITSVIDDGGFILGPRLEQFEKQIAAFCACQWGVGLASGTDALHLALIAGGIGPGDEVITPAFSFIATAEAISYIGARPVFVDIDEKTFNINPVLIEEKITSRAKAILPVHLYGQPAAMDQIGQLAAKYSLKVIEDSAQAIGARYRAKPVGAWGDAGCFSFFPTKNLGAFGDGGLVVTRNEAIYQKVKKLRSHGGLVRDNYEILGFNSRLDVIQAVVLEVKLKYLNQWIEARRSHANLYNQLLKDLPVAVPYEIPDSFCVYNQYTVKVKEREKLLGFLHDEGIGAMVYYPKGMHQQKIYQNSAVSLPVTERIQAEVLSLPIFPELNSTEIETVAAAIRKFYKK